MIEEFCVCGHIETAHGIRDYMIERPNIKGICWVHRYDKNRETQINSVHNFKLDNLFYIEALAKERNLI